MAFHNFDKMPCRLGFSTTLCQKCPRSSEGPSDAQKNSRMTFKDKKSGHYLEIVVEHASFF